MRFELSIRREALKSLDALPQKEAQRIIRALDVLTDNLTGDVKKLTGFFPQYRLRIGNYRALFELKNKVIVVHSISHRKDAY
jgi:mRNA interferase RelE/StbE